MHLTAPQPSWRGTSTTAPQGVRFARLTSTGCFDDASSVVGASTSGSATVLGFAATSPSTSDVGPAGRCARVLQPVSRRATILATLAVPEDAAGILQGTRRRLAREGRARKRQAGLVRDKDAREPVDPRRYADEHHCHADGRGRFTQSCTRELDDRGRFTEGLTRQIDKCARDAHGGTRRHRARGRSRDNPIGFANDPRDGLAAISGQPSQIEAKRTLPLDYLALLFPTRAEVAIEQSKRGSNLAKVARKQAKVPGKQVNVATEQRKRDGERKKVAGEQRKRIAERAKVIAEPRTVAPKPSLLPRPQRKFRSDVGMRRCALAYEVERIDMLDDDFSS
jgi:hypothetical protein